MKEKIAITVMSVLTILSIVGWILCVVHLAKTDFKAPYKAEIIYGIGTFTGVGAVLGYINIQD